MKRAWMIGRSSAIALLLAFSAASCEHAVEPQALTAPQEQSVAQEVTGEPQKLLGLLEDDGGLLGGDDGLLGLGGSSTEVRARDENGRIRTYTLVEEPVLSLDLLNLRVSQVIGLDGGSLTLLGHTVTVPEGALDVPALLTMIALPTGYVHVDLTALSGDLLSGLLDVGSAGFNRPVRLEMTYSRATNVSNERKLVILRLDPAGLGQVHEVIPSDVDRRDKTVTVWLDHFSAYCMAQ